MYCIMNCCFNVENFVIWNLNICNACYNLYFKKKVFVFFNKFNNFFKRWLSLYEGYKFIRGVCV